MPDEIHSSTLSVNKHYLDKVMDLSEKMEVEVTDDVYDARGMKLVNKGTKVSRVLQEKLVMHKLRQPLESCMAVVGGVNVATVMNEAKRIAETNEPMQYILKATRGDGASVPEIMARIQAGNALRMMLTIIDRGGENALSHSVLVSMLSVCLAKKIGLSEQNQLSVALAGLFHDIGELYIEPSYLKSNKRLLPHEWRHVVVHPHIGQMLISELENYHPSVGLAVSEHHERYDGTGYPRHIAGKNVSVCGQILSVAEMISGLLTQRDNPLQRAELALKIIPYEHAHPLVSVVSSSLRLSQSSPVVPSDAATSDEAGRRVKIVFDHIALVMEASNRMRELPRLNSDNAQKLLTQTAQRLTAIQRAFSSTGLDMYERQHEEAEGHKDEILFESIVATKEIQWRLRDVARDLALHSATLSDTESELFGTLVAMLDAEPERRQTAPATAARTLLLVDDEPDVLASLSDALHGLGCTILQAETGEAALELMMSQEVSVVLSDYRMPGMTGVELLSRIKAMFPQTGRLLLSGNAGEGIIKDAIQMDVIAQFLAKPWNTEELSAALQTAFEHYAQNRQAVQ